MYEIISLIATITQLFGFLLMVIGIFLFVSQALDNTDSVKAPFTLLNGIIVSFCGTLVKVAISESETKLGIIIGIICFISEITYCASVVIRTAVCKKQQSAYEEGVRQYIRDMEKHITEAVIASAAEDEVLEDLLNIIKKCTYLKGPKRKYNTLYLL